MIAAHNAGLGQDRPLSINLGLAYGTYTLMAMLSFVFVLVHIKETRGLELEAMK
jgi:hypothetical protein